MLRSFIMNVKKFFNEDTYQFLVQYVSADRKAKTDKFIRIEDKIRSVCAELLVTYVLIDIYHISDVRWQINQYGKAYLRDKKLFFNISHSEDMVVCAFSNYEIGIDIEKMGTFELGVARRFFTTSENDYLKESVNAREDFYCIWTLKEAYLKYKGVGLSEPLSSISFSILDGRITMSPAKNISFLNQIVENDYMLSVCCASDDDQHCIDTIYHEVFISNIQRIEQYQNYMNRR